jgi:hypothetical protein
MGNCRCQGKRVLRGDEETQCQLYRKKNGQDFSIANKLTSGNFSANQGCFEKFCNRKGLKIEALHTYSKNRPK